MAHGTQQRASVEPIAYVMLAADTIDFFENAELFELASAQLLLLELFEIVHLSLFYPFTFLPFYSFTFLLFYSSNVNHLSGAV